MVEWIRMLKSLALAASRARPCPFRWVAKFFLTEAGSLENLIEQRLRFSIGEFHMTDRDVLDWTVEEKLIFMRRRDELITAWEKKSKEGVTCNA